MGKIGKSSRICLYLTCFTFQKHSVDIWQGDGHIFCKIKYENNDLVDEQVRWSESSLWQIPSKMTFDWGKFLSLVCRQLCRGVLKYRRDQFVLSVLEPRQTRSGDREAPADWNVDVTLGWRDMVPLVSCQNNHLYPGTAGSSAHNATVSFINYFGPKNKILRTSTNPT